VVSLGVKGGGGEVDLTIVLASQTSVCLEMKEGEDRDEVENETRLSLSLLQLSTRSQPFSSLLVRHSLTR